MSEPRDRRGTLPGAGPSLTLSQAALVRLFDRLPLPVWINTGERGTTWVNRAMVEFSGRSMAEECGPRWAETIHPDDREEYLSTFFAAHRERQPCEFTYRLRSASGEYRWMLNRSTPWTDAEAGTFGYIGVCTDITNQRLEHLSVEHAAHLSSLVLDISTSLLSCSPSMIPVELTSAVARIGEHLGIDRVGIAILSEEHGNMSLAYHWINPAVEEMFVTLAELPAALQPRVLGDLWAGRPVVISDATAKLPGWEVDQVMWKARRIGATCVVPAPIRGDEVGVTFFETLERPFDWEDSVDSLVVLGKLMGAAIERWHLDRVLTERERHYRLLTEQSNDIVAVIDASGQLSYVSPSVERTLGHRVDDLVGTWVFDLIHPEDVVHETPSELTTWTVEQRLIDSNHDHHWFEITYTVPTDPETGSALPVLFLNAHDISAKRDAEDRMRTRMQFEDIVLGLSSRILEEGTEHIDDNIATALEYFGVFLDVDDVALFEIDNRMSVALRRYEWSGPQLTPASERIALSTFPHLMGSLERGLAVAVDDASTRNLDMALELFDSELHPGGAFLAVPLMRQRTATGFLRLVDTNGSRVWNDGDMSVLQLAAEVIGNALALKERDQALRQSEERFRLLAQDSADVIMRCDTNGVMEFVSDAARQLIGMEPADLVGRNLLDVVMPEDQPTSAEAVARLEG
ncbi:MAG: PAS domain S-box protein, partial [Acidimicrobiia bacterium]